MTTHHPVLLIARTLVMLTCVATGFVSSPSWANMALSNAIVHFESGEPTRQDVEISNMGSEALYVQIEPKVILNPGTEAEQRELITDPREHGLLVTPNRLVIPPGAAQVIRLVNIKAADNAERIFRITARPIAGKFEASTSGLKVLIGYEVLAIVYPKKPAPKLEVERNGRTLSIVNTGNTNVFLQEGFQCENPKAALEDCTPLPGKRMYPGMKWVTELPHDLPVRYYQSVGTRNFVETYP
jgi:P pilus assembly chaperone PapD